MSHEPAPPHEPLIVHDLVRLDVDAGGSKEAVIGYLADMIAEAGRAQSPDSLTVDLLEREATSSTGIPGGIAIPHCRSAYVDCPALGFARLSTPVSFGAADGVAADLVFLIVVPEEADDSRLQFLARLARGLVRPDFTQALRDAGSAQEVVRTVTEQVQPELAAGEAEDPAGAGGAGGPGDGQQEGGSGAQAPEREEPGGPAGSAGSAGEPEPLPAVSGVGALVALATGEVPGGAGAAGAQNDDEDLGGAEDTWDTSAWSAWSSPSAEEPAGPETVDSAEDAQGTEAQQAGPQAAPAEDARSEPVPQDDAVEEDIAVPVPPVTPEVSGSPASAASTVSAVSPAAGASGRSVASPASPAPPASASSPTTGSVPAVAGPRPHDPTIAVALAAATASTPDIAVEQTQAPRLQSAPEAAGLPPSVPPTAATAASGQSAEAASSPSPQDPAPLPKDPAPSAKDPAPPATGPRPLAPVPVRRSISGDGPTLTSIPPVTVTPDPDLVPPSGTGPKSEHPQTEPPATGRPRLRRLRRAVAAAVTQVVPFVTAGGLLMVLGLVLGGHEIRDTASVMVMGDPTRALAAATLKHLPDLTNPVYGTPASLGGSSLAAYLGALLYVVGRTGMNLVIPALAGSIAYGLAGRSAIAPGAIVGAVAMAAGGGFLGGMAVGIAAGYLVAWLESLSVPQSLRAAMPTILIPVVLALVLGALMYALAMPPLAALSNWLSRLVGSMDTTGSLVVMGMILGVMTCTDMGGPVSKAAYTVALTYLGSGSEVGGQVMATVMAAGMVPPLALALAVEIRPRLFSQAERQGGRAAWFMGAAYIPEGALPFAVADPLRVIPSAMVGGAVTGVLAVLLHPATSSPHGGFLVVGGMANALGFAIAVVVGAAATCGGVIILKNRAARRAAQG